MCSIIAPVGLFHGEVAPVNHEAGLFYHEVTPFSHEVGLFYHEVAPYSHEVGLFYHEVSLLVSVSIQRRVHVSGRVYGRELL